MGLMVAMSSHDCSGYSLMLWKQARKDNAMAAVLPTGAFLARSHGNVSSAFSLPDSLAIKESLSGRPMKHLKRD
jgi:hypothetical protein